MRDSLFSHLLRTSFVHSHYVLYEYSNDMYLFELCNIANVYSWINRCILQQALAVRPKLYIEIWYFLHIIKYKRTRYKKYYIPLV